MSERSIADQREPSSHHELLRALSYEGEFVAVEAELHTQAKAIRDMVASRYKAFTERIKEIVVEKDFPEVFADLQRNQDPHPPVIVFKRKLFNGEYLRVSPEYRRKLLQFVIDADTAVANTFSTTLFGNWSRELNDPHHEKLNSAELSAIQALDDKLCNAPEYKEAYLPLDPTSESGGILFNPLQSDRPSSMYVSLPDQHILDQAREHQQAVARMISEYEDSPLLKLIAAVHDFFKYRLTQEEPYYLVNELGLHEVGSAGLGRMIGKEIAKYFRSIFPDLPENLESALGKFFFMVIGTHGAGGYPQLTSAKDPLHTDDTVAGQSENLLVGRGLCYLEGSLYPPLPRPDTMPFCAPDATDADIAYCQRMARVLNAADLLTGTSLASLAKYNGATATSVLLSHASMQEYLQHETFASLVDNFNSESARHLGWSEGQFTKQKVLDSKRRIALLMRLFTKQDNHQALTDVAKLAESLANHFVELKNFISQPKTQPTEFSGFLESAQRSYFDKHFQELTEAVAKIDLDSLGQSVLEQLDETWEGIEEFDKMKKTAAETSNG